MEKPGKTETLGFEDRVYKYEDIFKEGGEKLEATKSANAERVLERISNYVINCIILVLGIVMQQ